MTNTTNAQTRYEALELYTEAKESALSLGLDANISTARRFLKNGLSSVRGSMNYTARRNVVNIALKPYTNEFGEQEAFGSLCDRNLPYAEKFVLENLNRFEGGVNNMTEAMKYIITNHIRKNS